MILGGRRSSPSTLLAVAPERVPKMLLQRRKSPLMLMAPMGTLLDNDVLSDLIQVLTITCTCTCMCHAATQLKHVLPPTAVAGTLI